MNYALVTGGLGFIGSFITRQLIGEGLVEQVVCLDHYGRYVDFTCPDFFDYRKKRMEGVSNQVIIERGEAKYYSVLHKIIYQYKPKYIFHLAALPLAKLSNLNMEEALDGAVISTSNILEIIGMMPDYRPEKFVYASSSMVYGDFLSEMAAEDHPTNPKELYGTAKLMGEVSTRGLGGFYNIPYTIIRPSAVYGPTDMNCRVSQIFIEKAFLGQKITVQGADEKLDFTYIKDVANGFVLAATSEKACGQTFNITHGKAHSLLDYALALKKHFPDLKYEIVDRDSFRPVRGTLSI